MKREHTTIKLDQHGYLADLNDWTEDVAKYFAKLDELQLTTEHWQIIYFLRQFYQQYQLSPPIRLLVNELKNQYGAAKGSSTYLYKLFPNGPAKQATKIAGLPKPVRCI